MASVLLDQTALSYLKKEVVTFFPHCKSSHITESLAVALGFNTNASLISHLSKIDTKNVYCLLDDKAFKQRLKELGYKKFPSYFKFEDLVNENYILSTRHAWYSDSLAKSKRNLVWRNLMVCAVNEALIRGIFTLNIPLDWETKPYQKMESQVFDFVLPDGLPVKVYIGDVGFYEVSIHVAVNPKNDSVSSFNAGFYAGDVFATGWLERQKGVWLQSSTASLSCKRHLLDQLSKLKIKPLGYGDNGKMMS